MWPHSTHWSPKRWHPVDMWIRLEPLWIYEPFIQFSLETSNERPTENSDDAEYGGFKIPTHQLFGYECIWTGDTDLSHLVFVGIHTLLFSA
jgi:hypothetical protein